MNKYVERVTTSPNSELNRIHMTAEELYLYPRIVSSVLVVQPTGSITGIRDPSTSTAMGDT